MSDPYARYRDYWAHQFSTKDAPAAVTHMTPEEYAAYYAPILDVVCPSGPATSILDYGCGAGLLLPLLRARWPKALYVGIDLDLKAIHYCMDVHGDDDLASWYAIPDKQIAWIPNAAPFDFIACHSVCTHLYEQEAQILLNKLYKALAPHHGLASISIHYAVAPGERVSGHIGHMNYDPAYFELMLADAGLRVITWIDGPLPQGAQRYYAVEVA